MQEKPLPQSPAKKPFAQSFLLSTRHHSRVYSGKVERVEGFLGGACRVFLVATDYREIKQKLLIRFTCTLLCRCWKVHCSILVVFVLRLAVVVNHIWQCAPSAAGARGAGKLNEPKVGAEVHGMCRLNLWYFTVVSRVCPLNLVSNFVEAECFISVVHL